MRYLTIALTKGRLANKTLELFERIGVDASGALDKNTRKLVFTNEELGLRFFLAKGPDVPTYVTISFEKGVPGEAYNIGSGEEIQNIQLVTMIMGLVAMKTTSNYDEYLKAYDKAKANIKYVEISEHSQGLLPRKEASDCRDH